MRLLLDEMWPPALAHQLCRCEHDVAAVAGRSELTGRPDAVVVAAAQAEGRAIVTENAGDYRLLAADVFGRGRSHAGLVLTSDRRFPRHDPRTAGRLVTALGRLLAQTADLTNQECWLS